MDRSGWALRRGWLWAWTRRAPLLAVAALFAAGGAGLQLLSPSASAQETVDPHRPVQADAYRDDTVAVDAATLATGEDVYRTVCSACHETGANRAPTRFIVSQMTPDAIHKALTEGVMKLQASGLTPVQKVAVAEALTKRKLGGVAAPPPLMCAGKAAAFDRAEPPVLDGWGFDAANTHRLPTAAAGISPANVKRLKLKWAVAFPDALRARSQPALAGGAVFIGSHDGAVYALDRATGCARWTFKASGEVRTGIVVSPWKAGDAKAAPLAYFGDILGNAYAVDAFTGRLAWRKTMDPHPSTTVTAAPVLHNGVLYVSVSSLEEATAGNAAYGCCTFRGSVAALDPATGAEKWRTYFVPPAKPLPGGGGRMGPSGVAIWGSVAIDDKRRQIYVTTGDNYSSPASDMSDAIVALDLATGAVKWAYQAQPADAWNGGCSGAEKANCPQENGPDFDFGAGPILARATDGRDYVVAGQKSGIAYGVDPDTGKLVWKQRIGRGGVVGGIHFGLATANGLAFVPVSDVPDGKTYDIPAQPGLYAVDVAHGTYAWKAPSADVCAGRKLCHPGYSGAISTTPDLVFAGSNDGHLRIYDTRTGAVAWDMDTTGEVTTVNGVKAHGGSMGGGAAPVPYGGMLFVPSGYGFAGKMPGNVLLAYGVD